PASARSRRALGVSVRHLAHLRCRTVAFGAAPQRRPRHPPRDRLSLSLIEPSMIGRVLLAALLAGIAAGFLMGAIQHVRITPLILEAEKYEHAGGHDHGTADAAATSQEDAWAPQNGLERTFYTTLASIVAGAGFAALLAGL